MSKQIKLKSIYLIFNLFIAFSLIGCNSEDYMIVPEKPLSQEQENDDSNTSIDGKPLFRFSVSGTGIDYIQSTDPDTFLSIEYKGQFRREIPGVTPLFDEEAYVFEATFTGDKKLEIRCRSNFGSLEKATEYANKLTDKLGKLPVFMRDELRHIAVFSGESRASAEPDGKFFLISDQRIDQRIKANQLEETIFHEATHVYFEKRYGTSPEWVNAQKQDASFVTNYAESLPEVEDIPETAIFVYTIKKYPGRLSKEIEDWVSKNIPNRYSFLEKFF